MVMDYFTASMSSRGGQSKKVAFLLNKLSQDALEEASEVPPEILEMYMEQASAVLYFAATGTVIENMPLPLDFPEVQHLMTETPAVETMVRGEIEA